VLGIGTSEEDYDEEYEEVRCACDLERQHKL